MFPLLCVIRNSAENQLPRFTPEKILSKPQYRDLSSADAFIMYRTSYAHEEGIKARARTGAHLETPCKLLERAASNPSIWRERPRARASISKLPAKKRGEREREGKSPGKRTAGKRIADASPWRETTSHRVLRRRGMSLENARAADCGGGLSRLAKPPAHGSPRSSGVQKASRGNTCFTLFSSKASTRRGSDGEAGVADKRREDDLGWTRTAMGFA